MPRRKRKGVEIDPAATACRGLAFASSARPGSNISARCTCAIEAAATGGPNTANVSDTGRSKAAATMRSASTCANGAILSCSDSRSRASTTPTTSGRVARNWPSFT
jgi:hypothetical protein